MNTPPDYHEAACCLNCEHYNFSYYNNCMKHHTTIELGMICSDYVKTCILTTKMDYCRSRKE